MFVLIVINFESHLSFREMIFRLHCAVDSFISTTRTHTGEIELQFDWLIAMLLAFSTIQENQTYCERTSPKVLSQCRWMGWMSAHVCTPIVRTTCACEYHTVDGRVHCEWNSEESKRRKWMLMAISECTLTIATSFHSVQDHFSSESLSACVSASRKRTPKWRFISFSFMCARASALVAGSVRVCLIWNRLS